MALRSPDHLSSSTDELLTLACEGRSQLAALSDAKATSLEDDRRDYFAVSSWARPMVIARGLSARTVLRNRIARARRDLRMRYRRLAAHGFEEQISALCGAVPAELIGAVQESRAELEIAASERAQLVAPFGGRALPPLCHWIAREIAIFLDFSVREVKNRILPRLPALAGLAVGWWIAQTFTDSRAHGLLQMLGLGRSGKRYVAADTLKAMNFWLPLLTSLVCAYLASRVGALIRHRYGVGSDPARSLASAGESELRLIEAGYRSPPARREQGAESPAPGRKSRAPR